MNADDSRMMLFGKAQKQSPAYQRMPVLRINPLISLDLMMLRMVFADNPG